MKKEKREGGKLISSIETLDFIVTSEKDKDVEEKEKDVKKKKKKTWKRKRRGDYSKRYWGMAAISALVNGSTYGPFILVLKFYTKHINTIPLYPDKH